jgi:hypothetical protein
MSEGEIEEGANFNGRELVLKKKRIYKREEEKGTPVRQRQLLTPYKTCMTPGSLMPCNPL